MDTKWEEKVRYAKNYQAVTKETALSWGEEQGKAQDNVQWHSRIART